MDVRLGLMGIGGAGGNLIRRMIDHDLLGVEFTAVNTDHAALAHHPARRTLLIGEHLTGGHGAGGNPDLGAKAAAAHHDELDAVIGGLDLLFITAGLGGGTGTGAAPVIADLARQRGVLTIGLFTHPFSFEGPSRQRNAARGLQELQGRLDATILLDNDRLLPARFGPRAPRVTLRDAFITADRALFHGVKTVTDLLRLDGLVNVDFADIRTYLSGAGRIHMGLGGGAGPGRARAAARAACASPLLQCGVEGATRLLVNIVGPDDLALDEVATIVEEVRSATGHDAPDVLFGVRHSDALSEEVRVMLIAAGHQTPPAHGAPPGLIGAGGVVPWLSDHA